jgi:hypothetical protein
MQVSSGPSLLEPLYRATFMSARKHQTSRKYSSLFLAGDVEERFYNVDVRSTFDREAGSMSQKSTKSNLLSKFLKINLSSLL